METVKTAKRVTLRMVALTLGLSATLSLWTPAPARADEGASHYNLALQYKREGKLAEAIAECEKAIQLRPDYAAAHLTLGNLYRGKGDYARAVTEFERTTKLQPKDATAHANLGAAYARLNRRRAHV